MNALELLGHACVEKNQGLSVGLSQTRDRYGARAEGWTVSVGWDDEPGHFEVECPTLDGACYLALGRLAIAMEVS